MNQQNGARTIPELIKDRELIQKAMRESVQEAVRIHKLLGHPIATWRDGKVVIVPPEEIEVEDNGPPKLPQDAIP